MKDLLRFSALLLCMIVLLVSCKKDVPDDAINPVISLVSPGVNEEVEFGSTITIEINATDEDGTIEEVRLMIDNEEIITMKETPYIYNLSTVGYTPGEHIISATTKDNHGMTAGVQSPFFILEEGIIVDKRDGQKYETVTIGSQTWFAQNLNYDSGNSKCYESENANCETYGSLYQWNDALNICPEGWHLPDNDEWKILLGFMDSNLDANDPAWDGYGEIQGSDAALKMKSTTGWGDVVAFGNGTDEFGFTGLPAGMSTDDGSCWYLYGITFYFSSTRTDLSDDRDGDMYYLQGDSDMMYHSSAPKNYYYSVRCIKD